ncbi:hypothetical protein MNBD_GAMMA10-3137 [hydrothermal vent metagenome]|uniref:Uncharacterized protein n=1 Tax=hydrothermal vent metagenome TaxID=652676 RepID=A0A3B0XS84_9ZZZZ
MLIRWRLLPFKLEEYIELVDLTGRQIREGKRGSTFLCSCKRDISASMHVIDAAELPILQRLNIENDNWKALTQHFEKNTEGLVGTVFKLKIACEKLGYQRTVCKQSCEQFFS